MDLRLLFCIVLSVNERIGDSALVAPQKTAGPTQLSGPFGSTCRSHTPIRPGYADAGLLRLRQLVFSQGQVGSIVVSRRRHLAVQCELSLDVSSHRTKVVVRRQWIKCLLAYHRKVVRLPKGLRIESKFRHQSEPEIYFVMSVKFLL